MADLTLNTPVQFLKGVGERRAAILADELKIRTCEDLLHYYPYRYTDRSKYYKISEIRQTSTLVQVKGKFTKTETIGIGNKKRFVARFTDGSGTVDCIWFKGISWIEKQIFIGKDYVIFGKPTLFNRKLNFTHPEIERLEEYLKKQTSPFTPNYPLTEKAKKNYINSKVIQKLEREVIDNIKDAVIDYLPQRVKTIYNLIDLFKAISDVHFPDNMENLEYARLRLKFDELFFIQLFILKHKLQREQAIRGFVFDRVGDLLNTFYKSHLPFELTNAQKRVIKEMRSDMKSGLQMNRLLQGDVGSGKTLVALMMALIASDNGFQSAFMAPTEILAQQHFVSLKDMIGNLPFEIELLTGSTKAKDRKVLHEKLRNGEIDLLIGTHALIENEVKFKRLGFVIIDEQHRFGVAQRAKLWKKDKQPPHVLVMTATPIPRTLALTVHGDLDVSVIDELPPGRKPIKTRHVFESKRPELNKFMKKEISKGRQVYIVFPLIRESEKLDFQNLEEGYKRIKKIFPEPEYKIAMVHGQMKPEDKEAQMQLFVENKAQIMVATTVIEVGVNVPNASIMVIESAQRFGLSQLHQLRGRVGRGADQSFCILLSGHKLTENTKRRLQIMVESSDGFYISEEDMKLRGPGNIDGTEQSGDPFDFKIASLTRDQSILMLARRVASDVLNNDPELTLPENKMLYKELKKRHPKQISWRQIS